MTSPASSGPAGPLFEGQVGAHYLLTLLAGGEPRGLPGTAIVRVEFQRAGEERHLDDVIVYSQDPHGSPVAMEIQVKRGVTFAPSDTVFKDVVRQIADASRRNDFWSSNCELAIATAKRSSQIDGAYQEVLTWARQLGDAPTFHARIQRAGTANSSMRRFVDTFRGHLKEVGAAHDDETVWKLLSRFQILVFDFTAPGSACEELAKERAIRVLHSDDAARAGNLWTTLCSLALKISASGGDRDRHSLLEDLREESFRFGGERRYSSARKALAEASRKALEDMENRVGDAMLTRHERVAQVRAALDEGRYVEIRGDSGVGKSGVLRHFAEQVAAETQVIVLTPGRTIPKGWLAMRAVLGFDGTARELLSDMASDGCAILFIDNLDSFGEVERDTVSDLVRESVNVPGLSIVATARRDFGVEEPSWLPGDVLSQLGRATPVIIGELNDDEVGELTEAAPRLKALLAKDHPAREVARNLFRLARLARQASGDPIPRTEIDMAEQWWATADGKGDGRRERGRVIRALAEQTLSNVDAVDVAAYPVPAIEALIVSGTLRDLGNDRVTFRHDVFREWAIANLLFIDAATIGRLPLNRPASASLSRGVELTARMILERATDGTRWHAFLTNLSTDSAHGAWRRAALLAVVHSEIGIGLLQRVSAYLLADHAGLLRELLRTMLAVEVEPVAKRLVAAGVNPKLIPENIHVPRGAAWPRVINWLLILGENLPVAAIPDVAEVYIAWSSLSIGLHPLTPDLQKWLYLWLCEIEAGHETNPLNRREPFGGAFEREQLESLESYLRTGFLAYCNRSPELAAQYLRSLTRREHNDRAVRSVLKFRGALASAAPKELAEFTAASLIPNEKQNVREEAHRRSINRVFGLIDYEFLPPSPNQGPFLELLHVAPEHGLSLIRLLVDHAITFYIGGREPGKNVITICLADGERHFHWRETYAWARPKCAREYCVASGLMALEAWAHFRIEAGEPFGKIISTVLDQPGAPACYLLVVVDLILSHWPKSREVMVPFLACPELLCIDRERQLHDGFEHPDILGLKGLHKEPSGLSSLADLNDRFSRRSTLYDFIGRYVVDGPDQMRSKLTTLLRRAAEKLGPVDARSTLRNPAFMAVHALNLADPTNWLKTLVTSKDGSVKTAYQYVPPKFETDHLKPLQEVHQERLTDINMEAFLGNVLEDPSRSSPEFVAAAIVWAQELGGKAQDGEGDEHWTRDEAVLIAATVAIRDGSAELRAQNVEWIRSTLARAIEPTDDPVYPASSGLRHNPIAIAFVGMIHLLKDRATDDDVRTILEIAARDNPGAAYGFAVAASALAEVDDRLIRAVLRCAFAARIQPNGGTWDEPEERAAERAEGHSQQVKATIDAEMEWLAGKRAEPSWPQFPLERVRPKHRFHTQDEKRRGRKPPKEFSQPDHCVEHEGAALWLIGVASVYDVTKRPWLRDLARTYSTWTMATNGEELDPDDDVEHLPIGWNQAYFTMLAHCVPGLNSSEIDDLALAPLASLPDGTFFDASTIFLRSVDDVYFNNRGIQDSQCVYIRAALVRRMTTSRGWKWFARDRSFSIEMRIGSALAVLFFNEYHPLRKPKCYLLQEGIDRISSFLPALQELVVGGPCPFLVVIALNLVEVSPRPAHLHFVIAAAKAWSLAHSTDSTFWIDYGIGRRVCSWIERVVTLDSSVFAGNQAMRSDVEHLLDGLVRAGVPEARRLEEMLVDIDAHPPKNRDPK